MSALGLTVSGAILGGEIVGLRCKEGRIEAIGPEVVAERGEEKIDAGGAPLIPPLINGHTHAAMTLFRGSGGDLPLMPWLEERSGRSKRSSTTRTSTGERGWPAPR